MSFKDSRKINYFIKIKINYIYFGIFHNWLTFIYFSIKTTISKLIINIGKILF
jgi:hypothetical protein